MPLPLPNLDDRRWADLVEEGRALIPRYAPRWTDHNIHDPGITLLELFAWLTEMSVYRLNRLPERHRRKFLALTGVRAQPPRAAQTVLAFAPEGGTPPFSVPAGAEFEATDPEGQPVRFRTVRDLDVPVVTLAAVQVDAGDGRIQDRTLDWRDGLPIPALGSNTQPGAALYLGFSELPAEVPVALALHFQGPGNDVEERARIMREAAAQHAACRQVLPDLSCDEDDRPPPPPEQTLPPHHSARVVWEVLTGSAPDAWTFLESVAAVYRPAVGQVMDDTRALTLDGIVEVNLPSSLVQGQVGDVETPLFYIRGRLESGSYDAPPMLIDVTPNGVVAEQAVAVFQTFTIAADATLQGPNPTPGAMTRLEMQVNDSGVITALTFFDTAAAPDHPDVYVLAYEAPDGTAPGRLALELVQVGRGTERPNEGVTLPQAPVQVESLRLYTQTGDAWQPWTRRDDLDASGRNDSHFVLDPTSGEMLFGDGERGRMPPAGALILAAYRTTRAAAGNVIAGTVTRPADTPRNALWLSAGVREQLRHITTNPQPASRGAAAEPLSEAIGRAVDTLHAHERLLDLCAETKCQTFDQLEPQRVRALPTPTRAVNRLDLERLALDVPGTRVARARAWAAVHPDYPCLQAPGVVTVVVVPDMPIARPEPSQGLLQAVKRFLDRRRVVGMRLEVVAPRYLEVSVKARVRTRPHTDAARVETQIRQALNAFLDPRSGGPDRFGWPFGRDVYRSEILHVIDGVAGVDHVLELSLNTAGGEPQCGNIAVCPTWLVTPGAHQIDVV
jgi:Baseplate J-like protein